MLSRFFLFLGRLLSTFLNWEDVNFITFVFCVIFCFSVCVLEVHVVDIQ